MDVFPRNDATNENDTVSDRNRVNEKTSLKTTYIFSIGTLIALAIILMPVGTSSIYPSVQYAKAGTGCLSNLDDSGTTSCTREDLSQTCKDTPASCTSQEKLVILDLLNKGTYNTPDQPPKGDPNACSVTNPVACIESAWNKFVALIGLLPAQLGSMILTLSGNLFNYSIDHTVVQFRESIFKSIEAGVNTAWTAFRDVANIVIIGMFAFIAISLILGIKEYGERKMIAHVLIIAVLINFSLLFTKMIIDASNFTAYQFYKAMPISIESPGDRVSTEVDATVPSIAGRFLQIMGATSAGATFSALEKQQKSDEGRWYTTILFGLLTGALFLLAAVVMLYGSFLLLARALLFIFLMIISPVAFASWLIPKFSQQGWSLWWDTLLKNAVFAPLLMILLWASLLVAGQFQATGGTLGSLVGDPGDGLGIGALFNYLIILGMLFMSIKIASMFSNAIAGFSMATSVAAAPLALGARFAGFAGRNLIGRGAARYGKSVQEDIGKTREMLAKVPAGSGFAKRREFLTDRLKNLESNKKGADWMAKRGFRLAGTQIGGQALKQLGVPSIISGGKVESFGDRAKRVSDDSAKRAVEVTSLSDVQKANIRKEAEGRARDMHIQEQDRRKAAADDAKRAHDETEERARAIRKEHQAAEQERERMREEVEQLKKKGGENAPEGHEIRTKYAAAKSNLTQQDEKIKGLQTGLQDLERVAATQNQTLEDATKALGKHVSEEESVVKRAGNKALEKATENLQDAAKTLATRIASGRGTRILSLGMDPNNSYISQLARERVTPRIKTAALREKIKTEAEMKKEDPSIAEGAASTSSKDDNVSPSSK